MVENGGRNSGNEVSVLIGLLAGTEASVVVGDIAIGVRVRDGCRKGKDGEGNESAEEEHLDGR